MRRLLLFAAVLIATSALAGLTGQISATGQGMVLEAGQPGGETTRLLTAMLQENLGLQYSSLPFGPSVALLSAGLQASNLNFFTTAGAPVAGRTASLDLSVGLLPRRAMPLRLFARGTVSDGGPQTVATLGGRESLAFGANLNLEPGGAFWPNIRSDYEEQRYTGPGTPTPLGDLRRTAQLGFARNLGAHYVSLTGRFDQEQRTLTGAWSGVTINGTWSSPSHLTTVVGTYFDRQLRAAETSGTLPLPGVVAGVLSVAERQLRLDHVQRFSPTFQLNGRGRLSDARFSNGSGALGGVGLGATWFPFGGQDLAVSASGDVGFTQTSALGSGASAGGSARAGYGHNLGPVRGTVFAGGGTQWCQCVGLTPGFLTSIDAGGSVGSIGLERVELRGDYRFAWVDAPIGRGGKRLEHHALAFVRARILPNLETTLSGGYDDGFRDYIDVASGVTASMHEQAFFVGGQVSTTLGPLTGSADLRHGRGAAVLPEGGIVNGPPPSARAITSGGFTVMTPLTAQLELAAGLHASFTSIDGAAPLSTLSGNAGLTAHLGRISGQLAYQLTRADTQGLVTTQHFLRLTLSRPFEVF